MPEIRLATPADAEEILAIYAPIVRDTAISFEHEVPTVADIAGRIRNVLASGFPWLLAETAGRVSGYAYASSFRSRAAYAWTAEVSVYVHPAHHRRGVGRAVYGRLLGLLEAQGYRSAYGVATAPNASSEGLHRSMGFEQVGYMPRVGYKFGTWHDVIYWHVALGLEGGAPDPVSPVADDLFEQSRARFG